MPRGRAGQSRVSAEAVQKAIAYHSDGYVGKWFNVTTRTVRRWRKGGLALYFRANPSREEWNTFAARLTSTARTSVDRHLSASSRNAGEPQAMRGSPR